jgi:adenosylcobinamide kinase/adenosylcobinamide-phosphate guanylyltransferase
LIDCLTIWISNLLTQYSFNEKEILSEVNKLVTSCENIKSTVLIVTNEVGFGIVPADSLSRLFRDIAGFANQIIALQADEAYLVTAGLPLNLKT